LGLKFYPTTKEGGEETKREEKEICKNYARLEERDEAVVTFILKRAY